jgi:hypothetical protein
MFWLILLSSKQEAWNVDEKWTKLGKPTERSKGI